jgi:hypothetical protein
VDEQVVGPDPDVVIDPALADGELVQDRTYPERREDVGRNLQAELAPDRPGCVYAKRPFARPEAVLAYLGRYTHRVAISNTRLIALADGRVSFRWRDYRDHNKSKVMTLAADEFIRRFLLHALPDGFHRIRHYGFLANRHRADKLALCRRLLAAPAPAHTGDDKGCPRLPDGARDR